MKRKQSSGLGGGGGASHEDEDSIDESLNKILAEVDPEARKAASDAQEIETAPEDDVAESVMATAGETNPVDPDGSVQVRAPDDRITLSGPALVDDVREEVTDVESPEALAALAAASADKAAEAAAAAARADEPTTDGGGTPVRDPLTTSLLNAGTPQEEIVTATGGGRLPNHDVITAENVGFFNPTGDARRIDDGELSASGDEASTADLSLSAEAREERNRVMRRSRPPTPATPLPRFGGGRGEPSGDEPEAELELSDLDYERQRSPAPALSASGKEDDEPSSRRTGSEAVWPSASSLSDSGPIGRTPPYPASITGTGRHTLPPPRTPTPGSRGRLSTPHAASPLGTPGPRISSPAIPIQAPIGSSGAISGTRSTSAVFSKVQLPLGGLVTVVGAAFGVGLIIGAVLWRGSGDAGADNNTAHAAGEARTVLPAAGPVPAAVPAATAPVATSPAPGAPAPPEPSAIEPPAPVAQPAPQSPSAASATASGAAAASDTLANFAKKVAAASTKPARPKRPPAAPGAAATPASPPPSKAKAAAWVDPFAQ